MEIEIPKIWKKVELKNYAPEFGEQKIDVWVNPPRSMLENLEKMKRNISKEKENESLEILAKFWDFSIDEVKRLLENSAENDPLLFTWLVMQTFKLIEDHRNIQKKNWMREFLKPQEQEKPASS